MSGVRIKAISLNHNTSLFTQLMARSLYQRNPGMSIDLTISDNSSTDTEDLASLRSYAAEASIPFVPSGFGLEGNVHGVVLQRFVADNPFCSHYLFLDPDVYFLQEGQIGAMIRELDAAEDAWCVMPRCTWDGTNDHTPYPTEQPGLSLNYELTWPWGGTSDRLTVRGTLKERVHPFCVLAKNTEIFRSVAREVSLSGGCTFSLEDCCGWDTMGLATSVMKTHGMRVLISDVMVFHFYNVSYDTEWIDSKRERCRKFLAELRAEAQGE